MCALLDYLLLYFCLHLTSAAVPPSRTPGIYLLTNSTPPSLAEPSHSRYVSYLVPGTTTFIGLWLYIHQPLPPLDVEIVLNNIDVQLTSHINQRGDGPLQPQDDPYEFGVPGCWCSTSSTYRNSLSYGVLRDAMRGLETQLVDQQQFSEASWIIRQGGPAGKLVGQGSLDHQAPSDTTG